MTVQVQRRFVVRIPPEIRKKLDIKEGDFLEIGIEDGRLVLVPVKMVPRDQAWFWAREWQEGEREAEEDIRRGRITRVDSVEALLAELEK